MSVYNLDNYKSVKKFENGDIIKGPEEDFVIEFEGVTVRNSKGSVFTLHHHAYSQGLPWENTYGPADIIGRGRNKSGKSVQLYFGDVEDVKSKLSRGIWTIV